MSRRQAPAPPVARPPGSGPRWRLWLLGAMALLAALAGGIAAAWWLFFHVVLTVTIADQPAGIRLPESFDVTAEVTNELDVAMDGEIATRVPFRERLTVPFSGRYDFDVQMSARVPVEFEVLYDGVLPIKTEAKVTIRTSLNYKNLKSLRNLKIETSLPLDFPLPVKLEIPVQDVIDLDYAGPLSAEINQDVETLVDTTLQTRLPIKQTITTPVTAALPLTVWPDQEQVRLIISRMLIDIQPARMLEFGVAEDRSGPVRADSPWGPLDTGAATDE